MKNFLLGLAVGVMTVYGLVAYSIREDPDEWKKTAKLFEKIKEDC